MGFLSPSTRHPSAMVALGKIPGHPEFLQVRTSREPEQSFDLWIEEGMQMAAYQYGPAWTHSFETGSVQGFVWRAPRAARTDALLCGVLFPSCDAVGRHYPLAIACEVPQQVVMRAPHVVPLAFGEFLERVHAATADFATLAPGDLTVRLAGLGPPGAEDIARAAAEYDDWCNSARIGTAWSAIFAESPVQRSFDVLRALAAVTEGVRGVECPQAPLSVRLPLGQGGPASAALWLDIIRRLCRWRATVPSTFWAVSEGALVVALGEPAPGVLGGLWHIDHGSDVVVDLQAATAGTFDSNFAPVSQRFSGTGVEPYSTRQPPSGAHLHPDSSMNALLDTLSR
jgi:type VI secretion system ImpM family protein